MDFKKKEKIGFKSWTLSETLLEQSFLRIGWESFKTSEESSFVTIFLSDCLDLCMFDSKIKKIDLSKIYLLSNNDCDMLPTC